MPQDSLNSIFEWLIDHWLDIAMALLGAIVLLLGLLVSDEGMRVLAIFVSADKAAVEGYQPVFAETMVVTVFVLFLLQLLNLKRGKRMSRLQRERDGLCDENKQIIKDLVYLGRAYLKSFADHNLKFNNGEAEKSERMTLYIHDSDGSFVPIVRYSKNAEYEKPGRAKYPDNQGVIAKAWQHGECFANDYPDPDNDLDGYMARMGQDSVPSEVVKEMKMLSRLYYGYRVFDERVDRPIALIVVESTNPLKYERRALNYQFTKRQNAEHFRRIAERLSSRIGRAISPDS